MPSLKSARLCFLVPFKIISLAFRGFALWVMRSFLFSPSFLQHCGVLPWCTHGPLEITYITLANWSEVRIIICNCWIEPQRSPSPTLQILYDLLLHTIPLLEMTVDSPNEENSGPVSVGKCPFPRFILRDWNDPSEHFYWRKSWL